MKLPPEKNLHKNAPNVFFKRFGQLKHYCKAPEVQHGLRIQGHENASLPTTSGGQGCPSATLIA